MVAQALGDQLRLDILENTAKYVPAKEPEPVARKDEAIGVLFIGEVAARLGITSDEVRKMIAAGKMRALPTGYTVTVPSSEVERLRSAAR